MGISPVSPSTRARLITTGDGGMLTTANRRLRPEVPALAPARHERSRHRPSRRQPGDFECYPELGYNYRMTDIQAAVGREQLKRLDAILARRRFLADRYRMLLEGIAGGSAPQEPPFARTNWQSYCVWLPEGVDQRQIMQFMLDRGVTTRRGIMCAHREAAYGTAGDAAKWHRLTESERAQDGAIILPLFHQMTEAEQDHVVLSLREALLTECREKGAEAGHLAAQKLPIRRSDQILWS